MVSFAERKQRAPVGEGLEMAYLDEGQGPIVVLLHGNPTSSYLWREVIPELTAAGFRCIAPDLLGMGDSDRLADSGPDRYRFVEHAHYLDAFLDRLVGQEDVSFVVHDWGSALGFHWAHRHPEQVRGIAYFEAIVRPLTWEEWPEASRRIFEGMRSDAGESLILDRNVFVEKILPASVIRDLGEDEMDEYRRPFRTPGEDRRPMLTWPRELPIDGEPADVHDIVSAYAQWLAGDDSPPKLFLDARPGSILTGAPREYARSWPNQREDVVEGIHFLPEDDGERIGRLVAEWLTDIGVRR